MFGVRKNDLPLRKNRVLRYGRAEILLYITADCVIFSFDGVSVNVLLIKRGIEPFNGNWLECYPRYSR